MTQLLLFIRPEEWDLDGDVNKLKDSVTLSGAGGQGGVGPQ